jgi:tRNA(fMet)-specific endonuclease VapC
MRHLDSDVVVDFLRGDQRIVELFAAHSSGLALCTPVVAELFYGANAAERSVLRIAEVNRLIEQITVVPFDLAAAEVYGRIRSQLRLAGSPIGEMDTLIAAVAIANHATLATRNVRHFGRIESLMVEDWSNKGITR